jgi:hypothetical protein
MITSAGHNLQVHLSRNDGQAANTLTQILATVSRVGFQIRSAVVHEQLGQDGYVMLRAWFTGATVDEVGAIGGLFAALGQRAAYPTI